MEADALGRTVIVRHERKRRPFAVKVTVAVMGVRLIASRATVVERAVVCLRADARGQQEVRVLEVVHPALTAAPEPSRCGSPEGNAASLSALRYRFAMKRRICCEAPVRMLAD